MGTRQQDVKMLYSTTSVAEAWRIIHVYGVRYIFVGFSELQQCTAAPCFPREGVAKFDRMVGHGLALAFHQPGISIYEVSPV
jgi:uncharacterized membrane protein